MSKKRTASELIVMCLRKYGEQSIAELSQKLYMHPKALSRTIGHLRKKGIVEPGTPLTPIIKTEFGEYQSSYSAQNKWKLTDKAKADLDGAKPQ